MPVSILKNVLMLRETPLPKILLLTDECSITGHPVIDVLVRQFQLNAYQIHYVQASSFSQNNIKMPDESNFKLYRSTCKTYDNDPNPLNAALAAVLSKSNKKRNLPDIPLLIKIDSQSFTADPTFCCYKKTQNNANQNEKQSTLNYDTNLVTDLIADVKLYENTTEKSNNDKFHSHKEDYSSPAGKANAYEKCVLFVDRLEDMLLYTNMRDLLTRLQIAAEGGCCVVLQCGRDTLPAAHMAAVHYAAHARLAVYPATGDRLRVKATVIREMGRTLSSHELLRVGSDGSIVSTEAAAPDADDDRHAAHDTASLGVTTPLATSSNSACCGGSMSCSSTSTTATATTAANAVSGSCCNAVTTPVPTVTPSLSSSSGLPQSTFSLSTTHQERLVKNSLLLPHHRAQLPGSGVVQYTPDAEDWDDEDPDDDLDI